jgi:hypothetical protein
MIGRSVALLLIAQRCVDVILLLSRIVAILFFKLEIQEHAISEETRDSMSRWRSAKEYPGRNSRGSRGSFYLSPTAVS